MWRWNQPDVFFFLWKRAGAVSAHRLLCFSTVIVRADPEMLYDCVAVQSPPRMTNLVTGRCNTRVSPQDGAVRVRLRSDARPETTRAFMRFL